MSGFLDPKSRVMDAHITHEGRRQMLNGGINIEFVSFSDIDADYSFDINNIFIKKNVELNLEAFSTLNDIFFQTTDESGRLKQYRTYDEFSSEIKITDEEASKEFLHHSLLKNYISTVSSSFESQRIITTLDKSLNDEGFFVEPNFLTFSITDDRPFKDVPKVSTITDVDSLFQDKRLRNIPNFLYLPPVQKEYSTSDAVAFGEYVNLSEQNDIGTVGFDENLKKLENYEINFSKFTQNNNLIIQIYESKSNSNVKLDIIYYGKIRDPKSGELKDLYFAGKLYFDEFDVPTFVNIFTMVI